jgi:hypothetical protein
MFTKEFLGKIQSKALSKKAEYRVLDRLERKILFIASNFIDRTNGDVIDQDRRKVLTKLENTSKYSFVTNLEIYGIERVIVEQKQANLFDYILAGSLLDDASFVEYLISLNCHQPYGWKL